MVWKIVFKTIKKKINKIKKTQRRKSWFLVLVQYEQQHPAVHTVEEIAHDIWHLTPNKWHMAHEMLHQTPDTWNLKPDSWHLTPDTWHLTPAPDTWHLTPDKWNLIKKFKFNLKKLNNCIPLLSAHIKRFSVSRMRNCCLLCSQSPNLSFLCKLFYYKIFGQGSNSFSFSFSYSFFKETFTVTFKIYKYLCYYPHT